MNTNYDLARSFAVLSTYQAQKNQAETTGAVAKNNDPLFKNNRVETTGAVAFNNGIYSSCQNGHFEAAA